MKFKVGDRVRFIQKELILKKIPDQIVFGIERDELINTLVRNQNKVLVVKHVNNSFIFIRGLKQFYPVDWFKNIIIEEKINKLLNI